MYGGVALYCCCCVSGSALVKCGYMQKKVGQAEREFMTKSSSHFLHPLRSFLEGDMKTIGVCTMVLH